MHYRKFYRMRNKIKIALSKNRVQLPEHIIIINYISK